MKSIIFFFGLFLINCNMLFSQFRGIIIDAETDEGISFATISFAGGNSGTTTNQQGKFSLKVLQDDTLTISHINYDPIYKSTTDLSSENNVIRMNKADYSIEEITVSSYSVKDMLQRSIEKSSEALEAPILVKSYYREFVSENENYTKFADGIITYYLSDWNENAKNIHTHIEQARVKSIENKNDDSYDIATPLDIRKVFSISRLDFLTVVTQNADQYNFRIRNYNSSESINHILITFEPKPEMKSSLYTGHVILDPGSDLIMEATLQLEQNLAHFQEVRNIIVFKGQITNKDIVVKYQMKGDLYYPICSSLNIGMRLWNKKMDNQLEFKSDCIIVDCIKSENQYTS